MFHFGTRLDRSILALASISKLTYTTLKHCATMGRFIMTPHTTLSAARQAGRKNRPRVAAVFPRHAPTQTTAFLIANLELEFIASNRKTSPLKIPNRKKIAISLSPKWHRHSCLCAVARLRIQPIEAVTSLPSDSHWFRNRFRNHPRQPVDPGLHSIHPALAAPFTPHEPQVTSHEILIETPRLEFPATTTRLSPLPISNRDKMGTFIVAAIPHEPRRDRPFRQSSGPKHRPSPAAAARVTSHESQITSHEFLSPRPKTFSASTPVLDFAQQFCSEENFSATTANRWNFGLCATIPREPRQARKGATVTGQLRVPRNTRSSSLARPLLKIAAGFSRLRINGVPKTVRIDISPAHRYDGSRVTSHKLRVTDSR